MSNRSSLFVSLVVLTATLAGCAGPGGTGADVVHTATLAPGTQASLPLVLENATGPADNVSVEVADAAGLDVSEPDRVHVEDGEFAAWIEVSVPEDAQTGTHDVLVSVDGPSAEDRTVRLVLSIEEPDEGIQQGKMAMVEFSAHTQDGTLAVSNNETVANAPLPKAQSFREPRSYQASPIPISPRSQYPAQIVQALQSAGVNQTLSVDLPQTYGPETRQDNVSREETIQRNRTAPSSLEVSMRRAQTQGIVDRGTQQGDPVDLPNSQLPYVVDSMNRTHVRIALDVQEGDNVTLHAAWPNATEILEVTEDNVTFRTDPTTEPGERFTWRDGWPNATEIVELTNETIVLRHSPEEGYTYTEPTRQGERNVTVQEVREDQIVLERENPHPLAGQTLTFTMTVVDQRDPPRQPRGGTPGPR